MKTIGKRSVIGMGESGWGGGVSPCQVPPAAGPSCGAVISKITVGSSLVSLVYGRERGARGRV